ncbi:MAG: DUF433 domain-containing protein [Chloroflexi bacterium]|nr:DUF433 domain-containing protein [Chloroflexota bacterium]
MSATIKAIYRRGLFEPIEPPTDLTENQLIELEIHPLPPVTSDPRIMGGKPCITGTRMPIDWVFQFFEHRHTLQEFLELYPQYTREQVEKAVQYAVDTLGFPQPQAG